MSFWSGEVLAVRLLNAPRSEGNMHDRWNLYLSTNPEIVPTEALVDSTLGTIYGMGRSQGRASFHDYRLAVEIRTNTLGSGKEFVSESNFS